MNTSHDCRSELRNADLRVTPARLGVLASLEKSEAPLDVTGIRAYLERHDIPADEATVFRILGAFLKTGLTKPVQFNDGKLRYEYAGKPPHHHFVCERCGSVSDVTGCTATALERSIESALGATVTRHSLEFFGLCKRCRP